MEEIWKDIKDYEGLYQVSSLGRVRSLDREIPFRDGRICKYKGRVLNINHNRRTGYDSVQLSDLEHNKKRCSIHRLVAEAFIPNPEGKEEINHKDENRQNNRLDNLEWVSRKENLNYGSRATNFGKSRGKAVLCIETNEIYYSTREAMRQTGINQSHISEVCRGVWKTAGGYHWKFVED